MSHWGKEIRYPYLDEDFVKFSLDLPVWEKTGFRVGKAVPKQHDLVPRVDRAEDLEPAKMLLRLAMWRLNMNCAAAARKRAIQFGARTAKMDINKGRTKGTDILVA
jgi:asparagine synthetase B (glutamine-hydrolysing)